LLPFIFITKHFIGLIDFLEFFTGFPDIFRIAVIGDPAGLK
jgi:hypothetical protein